MVKLFDAFIVGRRPYSFKPEDSDRVLTGSTIYFNAPLENEADGCFCGSVSCSDRYLKQHDLSIGDNISVARVNNKYELVT